MKFGIIILAAFILICSMPRPSESGTLADVVKKVDDAVAMVVALHKVSSVPAGNPRTMNLSVGAGVLVSESGNVITSAHLVDAADQIKVKLSSGEIIEAHVTASAAFADVALLQLESAPKQVVVATLADSDRVEVGDKVFVVAPHGYSNSLTAGHVRNRHKLDRVAAGLESVELFQSDAAINEDGSGGPMFNMAGEVIGFASRIFTKSRGFEGLGFFVTSNTAKRLLLDEPYLSFGLEGIMLEGKPALAFKLPQKMGFLVQRVAEDSPAARLRIRPGEIKAWSGLNERLIGGDIILEVAGIEITNDCYQKIQIRLSHMKPEDMITVKVLRGERILKLSSTRGR